MFQTEDSQRKTQEIYFYCITKITTIWISSINAHVFCHDLINPPAPDRDVKITLKLKNNKLIEFTKGVASSSESVYSVDIKDPQSVGFTTNGKSPFESQFDNLILAFNLSLSRVCISVASPKFSSFDRRYRYPSRCQKV